MGITLKNSSEGSNKNILINQGLVLTLILLFGIGLVQVYSSSYILAIEKYGDGLYFFKRQLVNTVIALCALFVFAYSPYRWIQKSAPFLWGGAALLVILTLVPGLGVESGGATRWLSVAGLTFEPSELLKVMYPLILAHMVSVHWFEQRRWDLLVKGIVLMVPIPFLLKQPDFGSVVICLGVIFFILFIFDLKWRYVACVFLAFLPLFYFLIWDVPYRKLRVLSFLDPWADPTDSGFQVIQSLLSFHRGGLMGVGLGQGQGKLFFLPEAHTDFTLAVLGEEIGFIGVLILFILYGSLVYKGFQIGLKNFTNFRRALGLALTMIFSIQVIINFGVVLGLLPTKGLTLPFLSYGGSSLVSLAVLFGLLLNLEKSEIEQ